ncbi:MAG: dihydroorotate dehydrogenase-like protein [Phycisphaerae bacterium]
MDMSTTYMGLKLSSPLVPSASPLSQEIGNIKRMEDAGAGAVVLWSLFEEQIEHDATELDYYLQYGSERFAESLTYFPQPRDYKFGGEAYLEHIAKAKKAVGIPIIASLNGVSAGGWTSYARKMQQAGADALELNVYFLPTDPGVTGRRIEEVYFDVLKTVKSSVTIPVAMKLSPFFSSMSFMAVALANAGADGLVLFNRFYQPDIAVKELEVVPHHTLSTSIDSRLPLRWIAILHGKVRASLAATGGIINAQDAAKMILAGADVTMLCSTLLRNGIGELAKIRQGLTAIMEEMEYDSVGQMKGVMSQKSCAEPAAFERANYMKSLTSFAEWGVRTLE